jgi:putative transposase
MGCLDPADLPAARARQVNLSLQIASPGQADLENRIKEICQTRAHYGYRRVHVLLRREGWSINQKKTRRVYRELGLQLRNTHRDDA